MIISIRAVASMAWAFADRAIILRCTQRVRGVNMRSCCISKNSG